MTFWYAPARSSGVEQFSPSLLPLQPPNEGITSPPAARICWIFVASSPSSGREPSHAGSQPPSDRMKASVNHVTPVADMTVAGSGGLPQPKYRYGAAPIDPDASAGFWRCADGAACAAVCAK